MQTMPPSLVITIWPPLRTKWQVLSKSKTRPYYQDCRHTDPVS